MARVCSRCAAETSGVAAQTVIPSPTCAGVLGMVRTIARCFSAVAIDAIVEPATMDTTSASDAI